jgi:hypothetical protein
MKNINIYNIKTIALKSPESIFSYYIYLALWILIIFPQFLVKVYKIWLWLYSKRELNKNGGSTKDIKEKSVDGLNDNKKPQELHR